MHMHPTHCGDGQSRVPPVMKKAIDNKMHININNLYKFITHPACFLELLFYIDFVSAAPNEIEHQNQTDVACLCVSMPQSHSLYIAQQISNLAVALLVNIPFGIYIDEGMSGKHQVVSHLHYPLY